MHWISEISLVRGLKKKLLKKFLMKKFFSSGFNESVCILRTDHSTMMDDCRRTEMIKMKAFKWTMSTMAIMALVFAVAVAGTAHAFVHIPGTFIPILCGEQKYVDNPQPVVDVQEICVGRVEGGVSRAVEFRFNDGSSKLFSVKSTADLLVAMRSGQVKSVFQLVAEDGEEVSMKVIQRNDGRIQSVSGHLGKVGYFVPEFGTIYMMQ